MRHPNPIGYTKTGIVSPFSIVNQSGDWLPYLIPFTYQHCKDGDTWACPNFSIQDGLQILSKFQYATVPDMSVSFSAVDSGTKPNVGNFAEAATKSIQNHWTCSETNKSFIPNVTTLAEFYATNTIPQEESATNQKVEWTVNESELPDTTSASLLSGLKISPVRVIVDGDYLPNGFGVIINNAKPVYDHMLVLIGQRTSDGAWAAFDSESLSIVYFAANYIFQMAWVYQLIKTTPQFIEVGSSIAYYAKAGAYAGQYVGCGNGDTMLSIWGNYEQPNRVTYTAWPETYKGNNLFIQTQ